MYSDGGRGAVLKTIRGLDLHFCKEVTIAVYISTDSKCPNPVLWDPDREHLHDMPDFTIVVTAISVPCRKIVHSQGQNATVSLLLLYQNKQGKYVIREHTFKTVNPIQFAVAEWTVGIFSRRKESWLALIKTSVTIKIQRFRYSVAREQQNAPLGVINLFRCFHRVCLDSYT